MLFIICYMQCGEVQIKLNLEDERKTKRILGGNFNS